MSSHGLTPDQAKAAQDVVSRVRGISSCHITTGNGGEVTEVHVVALGHKPAKLIARDVESLLKAELGIDVDYRRIGVVNLDAEASPADGADGEEAAHDANPTAGGVEEFPIEEYPSRFAFQSVNLFVGTDGVKAEVELTRDSVESFGAFYTENTTAKPWRVVAEATLRAVSEFIDDTTRLCLLDVLRVAIGDDWAFIVAVDVVGPRGTKSLAGCSIVSGNENRTIVFAALDAVNRVIGKLEFKSSIEYKIR